MLLKKLVLLIFIFSTIFNSNILFNNFTFSSIEEIITRQDTSYSTSSEVTYKFPFIGVHSYSGGPHANGSGNGSPGSAFDMSGIDFGSGPFESVVAIADGEVIAMKPLSQIDSDGGLWVAIKHDNGIVSMYWHLSSYSSYLFNLWNNKISSTPIRVRQGTYLGNFGDTGCRTWSPPCPPHYHLEFRNYDPADSYLNINDIGTPHSVYGLEIDGWRFYSEMNSSGQAVAYYGSAVHTGVGTINKQITTNKGILSAVVEYGFPYNTESNYTNTLFASITPNSLLESSQLLACIPPTSGTNELLANTYLDTSNAAPNEYTGCEPGPDDTVPPTGYFTAPSNGSTVNSNSVNISVNASDNTGGSGVRQVDFSAKWGGIWYGIGSISSSPYSINWNLCNYGVPKNTDVELGMQVLDNAGNLYVYSQHNPNPHITFNYDCTENGLPSPGQWHAEAWMNKYMAGYVNKSEYWPGGVSNITYPFEGFEKDWGTGAPYSGFPSDGFSFKIYSDVHFNGGHYFFRVCSDDGVKLIVDNQMKINEWWDRGGCLETDHWLSPGYHPVEVNYYENTGNAYIKLYLWGEEYPRPELDAPDGRITSPSNNTYVTQNPLTIWSDVSDDKSGVDHVNYRVYHCVGGCQWRNIGTSNTPPYQLSDWDWSSLDGQQIKLAIDLYDKTGKSRSGAGGEVTINLDKTAPSISISSPSGGTIDADKQISIITTASDNGSGIARVRFFAGYDDGTNGYWHEIGTDTNGSDGWGLNWNAASLPDGKVVDIYVSVYDVAGNMGSAGVYAITLGNPQKYIYLPVITNGSASAVNQEQIVFVSRANGNSEIYLINTDGTGLSRLTNNSSEDVYPNYSPDGSKIVFSSKRTGKEQIYTMLANGSQQTRLLADTYDDGVPEWSPDGTKIAFTRYADYDGNGVRAEVFVMNSDGSNVNRLTTTSGKTDSFTHGCWSSGWSPDSKKILYYCYVGYDQIWIMNADGSNKQQILNDSYWNAFPKMSPDGKKIVFVSWRYNNYDVYTVNLDGSSLTRLTTYTTDEWAPDWSPDGKKILFEANRDGKTQVYWMNADGSQQTRITDNTSYAGQGRWRP
ncbi:periplasmic component of the Tol biopolymer transport system [Anaerolinea thermolimosa]|uniref:Ig-like domain-containing protein n=1 Tax=Anaerolinea thermolimosa TaxID=229919 RepID=UPI000A00D584|nr:Ig-like domain-containing protein [Anaerolinea thermolimosa]GAP05175.1 periplasmic component of the Tol biopolymer transport system [Anaerolinea thermolimosa]